MKEIIEQIPAKNIEEAVQFFQADNTAGAIEYLKGHKEDAGEFCMQVYEQYQDGDHTGVYRLSMLIKELL
ncbi:hypothetical protein HY797_03040 [Candidatus Falkowbacteria bacterium]|nr:hypothetical protein [Candidatus Falkowbacteria bacterium]